MNRFAANGIRHAFEMIVIARCAKRAVAIQLECFVVPQSETSRNDSIRTHPLAGKSDDLGGVLVAPRLVTFAELRGERATYINQILRRHGTKQLAR